MRLCSRLAPSAPRAMLIPPEAAVAAAARLRAVHGSYSRAACAGAGTSVSASFCVWFWCFCVGVWQRVSQASTGASPRRNKGGTYTHMSHKSPSHLPRLVVRSLPPPAGLLRPPGVAILLDLNSLLRAALNDVSLVKIPFSPRAHGKCRLASALFGLLHAARCKKRAPDCHHCRLWAACSERAVGCVCASRSFRARPLYDKHTPLAFTPPHASTSRSRRPPPPPHFLAPASAPWPTPRAS